MKLLVKTNRYYLSLLLVTYASIATIFYFATKFIIYDEVENRLRVEKRDFEEYTRMHQVWDNAYYFVENKIDAQPETGNNYIREAFTDTLLFDKYSQEMVPFRQISFHTKIGGELYKVRIRKSLIETEKLIQVITSTMLAVLGIALLVSFMLNNRMSRRIWHPFYDTLQKIKSFDLASDKNLGLSKADIYEFEELNNVFDKMSNKMRQDYQNLKEFTENASHEMQTPVALINARIEELIQTVPLSEQQFHLIQEIHSSSNRMAKISQSLLLLSKIDNQQFAKSEEMDFGKLLEKKIDEFEELFSYYELEVVSKKTGTFLFQINPILSEILLNNLLGNSIKHNLPKGKVIVEIEENGFAISNTGQPLEFDPELLFERFKKGKTTGDSSGLGLAIVKKIAVNYGLNIHYTYQAPYHRIRVSVQA